MGLRLIGPLIVIGIVLNVIGSALGTYNPKTGGCLLSGLFGLAALIPSILVDIKRWHDRDKSEVDAYPVCADHRCHLAVPCHGPNPVRRAGDGLSDRGP